MSTSKFSESPQFVILKDSFARRLLSFPELQNPVLDSESSSTAEPELDDFSSYLAYEVWSTLPPAFRNASYETRSHIPDHDDLDSIPLDATPVSFADTLISYGIASDIEGSHSFLRKVLASYITEVCAPPPVWSSTRTKECEICEREVPLTYHHLIPRSTHAKVVKKKWHPASMLNSVAWLCRPCHTAVHQVATNEELAQKYYTVSLLLEREDIQRWGKYASKQRFGVRRG
ncbi:hypothetical protein MVEN_02293900 [Mycena venus]|uniref:HNH domain-containing protein n=1 Tax=Mycena venus TaxID=2733690 RepID=A0A8H6X526_9AGAR|nr:hypothetical protein MVEN_02293900 [Mycena venus]